MRSRSSRWDGSQDPFGPDIDTGDILDAMSSEILSGAGADSALRRLMRRGIRGRFSGLDALRTRLRHARRQEQDRLDLAGPLEDVRERLEQVVERERTTLSFKAEDDARMRETFLDSLPPDVPGRINELREYRFVDPQAQREFDELMEFLKEQVLSSYFRNMAQGLQGLSPEELQRFKDMLAELNSMIEARDQGQHTQQDFERYMRAFGEFFTESPRTFEDGLDLMPRM